jgi:DNA-binding beta-propeller fold protein YncE
MIVELELGCKMAFAMITHPRLGADSVGARLEDDVVRVILDLTLEENNIVRAMQGGECFEVRPFGGWAPRYVAIDSLGRIVVSDYDNHQLKVFSGEDGSLLQSIGGEGKLEGQLNMPLGVAISREGNFVVADSRNHRLQVFQQDGTFLRTIGRKGKAEGELQFPMGVAVDNAGNITVADWGNHRIQVFDTMGSFQRTIGHEGEGDGELKCPSGVAVNESGTVLVVADGQNHRVQIFDGDGTFRRSIRRSPDSDEAAMVLCELNGPMGIALDVGGNIMVSDKSDCVHVFQQDGTFLRSVGRNGTGCGELHGPGGVAVDGAGNIVVADCKNRRVQVFAYANGQA